MRPRRYGVTVAAWGLSVLLGTAVLYAPGDRAGIAGSLRWLAVLVGVVLGGGLLLHGVRSLRGRADDPRQYRGPAATLAVVGLLAVLGSAWTFRPWPAGGLAGGIQAIGLAAFLVGGGLFVALGVYSYRTRSQRLPLAIVAGLTGAGVFYPVDDSGVLRDVHPILWVALLVLLVCGPALAVYLRWAPARETDTAVAG